MAQFEENKMFFNIESCKHVLAEIKIWAEQILFKKQYHFGSDRFDNHTLVMAFSFQHVGQAELRMEEMPNPDVLAGCHASGKRTGAMTQEILFFPLRWLRGPCQHINWGEDRGEGGSGG